jgi:putative transposase
MDDKMPWPHVPTHRLAETGTYFVTAATLHRKHILRSCLRLDVVQRGLLTVSQKFGWQLEAWAIFSNHYHFIGHSPETGAKSLPRMLRELHGKLSLWLNRLDQDPGRQVWHNYRETKLDNPGSYFARLNYVHTNPVRHGLVKNANEYRWCSANWFEQTAETSKVKTIYGMKLTRLKIADDFEVLDVQAIEDGEKSGGAKG